MSGPGCYGLPHWIVFTMLDGTVVLATVPIVSEKSIKAPRINNGAVEVAFLECVDRECKDLRIEEAGVHVHFIRYFEVHPFTLEGAVIH